MSMTFIASRAKQFSARVVVPLRRPPAVEVVLPVHNEEKDLARSVRRLHAFLHGQLPYTARITIADNASTDATADIADGLASDVAHGPRAARRTRSRIGSASTSRRRRSTGVTVTT